MLANFFANRHPVILFFMWLLLPAFNVYALPPGPFVIKEELTLQVTNPIEKYCYGHLNASTQTAKTT